MCVKGCIESYPEGFAKPINKTKINYSNKILEHSGQIEAGFWEVLQSPHLKTSVNFITLSGFMALRDELFRIAFRFFLLCLIFVSLLPALLPAQALERYEYESVHMGTTFRIVLYSYSDSVAQVASKDAFQRIEGLNNVLSDYKETSELNQLSRRSGSSEPVTISSPLFRVISKAQEVALKTGGAFDVTVGPYVELWRRMNRNQEPELPTKETLQKQGASVGYRHIKIDSTRQAVALLKPDMQLDPGGIAKGYAADEALKILEKHGISSALIDAGGDIVLGDAPPGKRGWNISLLSHNKAGEPQAITLLLANRAVATSGDLFQHVVIEGKRYSHIINPHTGLGLTNQSLVTVVAPDGITADSYASAVSVLGPGEGMKLIERTDKLSGFIEYTQNDSVKQIFSSDFKKLLQEKR